jgi:sodium/potassium-transporting ATPase subunit beta
VLIDGFAVTCCDKNTALFQLNTIWVSCEGESPADVENIGPVTYIPGRGFPGYFYPYKNSEGYLSPVMAIHFERPRSKSDSGY